MGERGHILYFAPSFLEDRRHKPLRGVQVFDLQLVAQLVALGHRVVVPAERTWSDRFAAHWGGAMPEVVYTPSLKKPVWNALAAGLMLKPVRRGRPFDAMFLGNPARGVLPAIGLLRRRRVIDRIVLQANKAPTPAFCARLRAWNATITAVSRHVAEQFPADLRPRVSVYYGIANAGAFTPAEPPRPDDGFVRFCLIGKLDNAWKGAGLALRAFRALPERVRSVARLHLASYQGPAPEIADPCVVVEPWLKPEQVPAFLRRMDAMLVPSFGPEETFSQAIVQGMLAGLPIIASDLPVLSEKLDQGGGLTFPAADRERVEAWSPAAMAQAIERLSDDAGLRASMGAAARRTALDRYVWDTPAFVDRFLLPKQQA